MAIVPNGAWVFDFDNHYYEAPDAFTRYADRSLGYRGVRWADIDGKRRLLVGGAVSSYVANPSFDPVAKPGALFDWYRGNPRQQSIRDAFGKLEPLRSEYQDRDQRLKVMDEQGLAAVCLFPTLGVGLEDALTHDPDAAMKTFHGFNRWLEDDWGYRYEGRIFAVPYLSLLDLPAALAELDRVIALGAVAVNLRSAPVTVAGGHRSPFDPAYDPFWARVQEAGIVVANHAGLEGYDVHLEMWEQTGAESSLFRSPLRAVITKGRAVTDFYAAACCHLIFERFPGLRFASVENGAAWAPDLLHRLDDAANRNPGHFREHPRDQFGEHVWITPFWEDHIDAIVADVRTDRLLLGSDWPHAEGTRAPLDFITESLGSLSEDELRRVARDNALDVLRVELPR